MTHDIPIKAIASPKNSGLQHTLKSLRCLRLCSCPLFHYTHCLILSGEVADFAVDDVVATFVVTDDYSKLKSISCYNRRTMLLEFFSLKLISSYFKEYAIC